jgi:hypothetical protein
MVSTMAALNRTDEPRFRQARNVGFDTPANRTGHPSLVVLAPRHYDDGMEKRLLIRDRPRRLWAAVALLPLFLMPAVPESGNAQTRSPAAFDTLEAGVHYAVNINENEYHDFWDQGQGAEAWALTPFYAGDLKVGVRYLLNTARTETTPDYHSTYIYLGWSYPFRVTRWITIHPGATLGGNVMNFDVGDNKFETEASTELFARLGVRVYGRWNINVTGSWMTMLTYRRIEMAFVTIGVSGSFGMPGWLRGFLE